MRIGEVAREAGVNIQTLRYYERRGLLPGVGRRASGYRDYAAGTVPLVRFIKHAQGLGFTLREIDELVQLRENPEENALSVCDLASAKIDDIAGRIRGLMAIQRALEGLVSACRTGRGTRSCPIIEALDDDGPVLPPTSCTASQMEDVMQSESCCCDCPNCTCGCESGGKCCGNCCGKK